MIRKLLAAIAIAACSLVPLAANATINPVISLARSVAFGDPVAGRTFIGTITFGSSDTYTAGGFTITPQQFGFANQITALTLMQVYPNYTFTQTASGVNRVVQITQPVTGVANVAATATTATITLPALFSTSPSFGSGAQVWCQLDDNANGGGSGTWSTTAGVSTCKWASATTFTLTTTAAAPTGGGNFEYVLPYVFQEIAAGTAINTFTTVFVATGN